MVKIALLTLVLLVYNNLLNLWGPFNGMPYVPLNLVAACALVLLALGPLGLSADAVGLTGMQTSDALLAGATAVGLTAPLFGLLLTDAGTRLMADERLRGVGAAELAYQALVRVPLGTVLLEELAFRGVLFACLQGAGAMPAALYSSAVFGLWHVGPTINLIRANRPNATGRTAVTILAGAITFTTVAGLLLTLLRVRSGALTAPFLTHWGVNGLASVAAVLAHRRLAAR